MNKFNININIQETIEEFTLTEEQVEQISRTVKETLIIEIYRNWTAAANKALNSSKQGYVRGLQIFNESPMMGGIKLIGTLNNMIEKGATAFDIKMGLLNSPKAKISKNGSVYISIPFRYATPGSGGFSEVFSGVLPPSVYSAIKTLAKSTPQNVTPVLRGDAIPKAYRDPMTRIAIPSTLADTAFAAYTHKNSLFDGLMRSGASGSGGGNQGQYKTFRTVSSLSDPNSWIHKGIIQYNLANEGMRNTDVGTIVDNTVDKMLDDFGF